MPRKIIILTGSPRENGNTVTVANWIAESARAAGAEVELVNAATLNYKVNGCIACMGCQQSDQFRCIIDDEAAPILLKLPDYDVVVFATPTYFMGFSAQLKLLIDRMYSLVKFDPETMTFRHPFQDTVFGLIAVAGGGGEAGIQLVVENMRFIARFLGKSFKKFLVPTAPLKLGEIITDTELKDKSVAFGKELAG
ncbi:MAG: flavodoxin family protein [bacterium]|nr:flavodoxin family protein [bacterium]